MQTRQAVLTLLLVLVVTARGERPIPLDAQFLRDFAETRGYRLGLPVSAKVTPDGQSVLFLQSGPRSAKQSLYEFAVATGQTRELLTTEKLLAGAEENLSAAEKARRERMRVSVGGITSFQLSPDGAQILAPLAGKLYLIARASGVARELPVSGDLLDPQFSPDGRQIAFVRDFDLWTFDPRRNRERRITTGGTELIQHGLAEFVAQEEMSRMHGYWWAPDGKSLLYQESDATGVEVWRVADPFKPEQEAPPQFYPRPGKANVKVRLGIVSARGGKTTWLKWDAGRFPYFTQAGWHKQGGLTIGVQTRDQRQLRLLRVNPKTGETHELLIERDAAWVNLDQDVPKWLDDGSGFLWTSERDGAWKIDLRKPSGELARTVLPATPGFAGLVHLDSAARQVFFLAGDNPTELHLFRVNLDGGPPEPLTSEPGVHTASLGGKPLLRVVTSQTPGTMPRTTVLRADGSAAGELPSVAEDSGFRPRAETLRVGEGDGFWAEVVRPRNFDSAKRYPVVVDIYGGPHSTVVSATKASRLLPQWLAEQGFIVVSLDNRGTPRRGRGWERAILGKFGSLPVEDQVAGLRALGAKFPELDLERVGITGWSFGGYMSALAVLRRPEVFHAAVAGAPVTDWLDYDTHYTERYLGVPGPGDTVYADNSLLKDAPNLRRPLLLIHGTADDNVFFRHSLKLADALTRAGKEFEFVPFAGFTHMVPEPAMLEQRWVRTAEFFHRHLGVPK